MDLAQEQPDTVIVAGDEASLYHQATLMRAWNAVGQTPLIKVTAQRTMTHFYGALNLATGKATVMRATRMNSAVTALFLLKLLAAYPDQPILLLWDRAKWHLGAAVKAVLNHHGRLQILFFPPASPELNPQEHVWKATREAISHNHTQPYFATLADEFEHHLDTSPFPCSLLHQHDYFSLCAMFN
jgi:transposase